MTDAIRTRAAIRAIDDWQFRLWQTHWNLWFFLTYGFWWSVFCIPSFVLVWWLL